MSFQRSFPFSRFIIYTFSMKIWMQYILFFFSPFHVFILPYSASLKTAIFKFKMIYESAIVRLYSTFQGFPLYDCTIIFFSINRLRSACGLRLERVGLLWYLCHNCIFCLFFHAFKSSVNRLYSTFWAFLFFRIFVFFISELLCVNRLQSAWVLRLGGSYDLKFCNFSIFISPVNTFF